MTNITYAIFTIINTYAGVNITYLIEVSLRASEMLLRFSWVTLVSFGPVFLLVIND